jgi:pSer/pThr/pTyr-binding forkhead associated (FHA) protein
MPQPEPEPEPEPERPEDVATQLVPEQPPPAHGPVARLLVSHGETVDVDRPVVLGRAPEPGASDSPDPRLVSLPSPSREISSTHLEIRPGAGTDLGYAVVTDLGSTNGTVVVQPGMPPEELLAGVGVRLLPGAVIDLGDGISLEVVAP